MKKIKSIALIKISFGLCFLYWFYLSCLSEMIIIHDSVGYESLGNLIANNGWLEYLKNGPQREPLYPLLISIAITLSKWLACSFRTVQIFLQVSLLFLTQILSLKLMEKLKINNILCSVVILYIGISPALINATFRLYSEIITFPILLAIILINTQTIVSLHSKDNSVLHWSFFLGLSLCLMTLAKGIFELITPLLLFPYFVFAINAFIQKRNLVLKKLMIFFLTFLCTYYMPIISYKYANKALNGNFTLTDRGAWALYGNTARRMEPMNKKRVLASFAYARGWGLCRRFFDQDTCSFWSYIKSDEMGAGKRTEITRANHSISEEDLNKRLIQLSQKEIAKNPFQYLLFYLVESQKLVFWDSMEMAFVLLPKGISHIYGNKIINTTFFFLMPLLTYLGIFHMIFYLCMFRFQMNSDRQETTLLFCCFTILLSYAIAHSFFFILPRYSFCLGPIYLILIAFWAQRQVDRFSN